MKRFSLFLAMLSLIAALARIYSHPSECLGCSVDPRRPGPGSIGWN
jgi:hypothetical protein